MNFWRRRKYEPWLVPYAEGTLDGQRRAELEAQMARDPALASEAEAQRQVTGRLRAARLAETEDAETSRLWPQIEARLQPPRRSVAPLAWVGGACAAACLAWAAVSGPFGESSLPPPVGPTTPQVMSAPAGSQAANARLARPWHRSRPPRPASHVAERPARPAPVVAVANRSDQQVDESRTDSAPKVVVEAVPPAPKAAVSLPGAARFQTAEGIHEKAAETTDNAPTPPSQNDAEMKIAAPVPHDFSPDSSAQATLSDAAPAPAVTPPQATPVPPAKRRHRRHRRRTRHQPAASLPATPAPTAIDRPPSDNAPLPPPMPGKPVD